MTHGSQALLFLWGALIVGFVFIRISTRLIRANVRWWPGNFTPGGRHIHHVVFGLVFVLAAGVASFTPLGRTQVWEDAFAALFGLGAALVLDEFALVLHLRDVYWSEDGRSSIDAVVVGVALTGFLVTDITPFGLTGDDGRAQARVGTAIWLVINVVFVIITLLKGKIWAGFLGIFVPGVAIVAAIRVARPGSPWGRRYPEGSRRRRRAEGREVRRARAVTRRYRLLEVVTGPLSLTSPTEAPLQKEAPSEKPPDRAGVGE